MNTRERVVLLQRAADQLPLLPALRDPHALAAVRSVLQAEIDRRISLPVRLALERPGVFLVDGRALPPAGKGMLVAFLAFSFDQGGMEPWPASAFFHGKRAQACAIQALDRAAEAVALRCRPLAEAIQGIGTSRGLIVVKRRPREVVCSSAWLVEISQRAAALGYEC